MIARCIALGLSAATLPAADRVFAFDDGDLRRWQSDSDQVQVMASDELTYDGEGKAMVVSGKADPIACFNYQRFSDHDTRCWIVYYAEGLSGDLIPQGASAQAGKNLHLSIAMEQDHWAVASARMATMTDWNGKDRGEGHDFRFLMLYASVEPAAKVSRFVIDRLVFHDGEDLAPPSATGAVDARVSDGAVVVRWTAAQDDVGVLRYDVHRTLAIDDEPTSANLVGDCRGAVFRDDTLANFGTYHYRVVPIDLAGNRGPASTVGTVVVRE